jgi:hypothetical protein
LAFAASRRTLLGALAVIPAIGLTASAVGIPIASEWHAAIADWQRTRATWNGIATNFSNAEMAHWNDPTPVNTETYERLDALNTDWMHKDDGAMRRIVATPAPDIEAVIYKIRLGNEHGLPTEEAVIADLRRLAQEARV